MFDELQITAPDRSQVVQASGRPLLLNKSAAQKL